MGKCGSTPGSIWFWYLAQKYFGSVLKVFWQLTLVPEHLWLSTAGMKPTTFHCSTIRPCHPLLQNAQISQFSPTSSTSLGVPWPLRLVTEFSGICHRTLHFFVSHTHTDKIFGLIFLSICKQEWHTHSNTTCKVTAHSYNYTAIIIQGLLNYIYMQTSWVFWVKMSASGEMQKCFE